jgi:hypothetical protein
MSFSDEEKRSLHNTPVTELEIVDINDLVPNTLYLYEHTDGDKAVVVFIDLTLRGRNRDHLVGKTLTDKFGNLDDFHLIIDPRSRNDYKFYKRKMEHPAGLHEEIKRGIKLVDPIHPLAELAYKQLSKDEKKDYLEAHTEGLVPPPPGSKRAGKIIRKGKRTTKRNNKRSRSLRGKTKTKTKIKTRKQK